MKHERARAARSIILPVAMTVVIVVLAGASMASTGFSTTKNVFKPIKGVTVKASSDPVISVDGNDELAAVPGILGNGSAGNPYIIQDKVINASASGNAGILIANTDAYLTIRNCTVTGSTSTGAGGITLQYVQNVNLTGNLVMFNFNGIRLVQVSWSTVRDNIVGNNSAYGIYMASSTDNVLSNNTVTSNTLSGIFVDNSSPNNVLIASVASRNGHSGIHLQSGSNNITVSGNTLANNSRYGIYVSTRDNEISGNTVVNNSWTGIYLTSVWGNSSTVSGNTACHNGQHGIFINGASHHALSGNNASFNALQGVYLLQTYNVSLTSNTVANNTRHGISLVSGSSNAITGNLVTGNGGPSYNGITLETCSNNNVSANTVRANQGYGIFLSYAHFTTVAANNVSLHASSSTHGILLDHATNNTLTGNNVVLNRNGIRLTQYSYNNTLVLNNASFNTERGVHVTAASHDNVIVGTTARNNAWQGIHVYNCLRTTLENNTATGNLQTGISMELSTTARVKGNIMAFNNNHGMYLANAQSITVHANTITNNSWNGIDIAGGASNNVTGNIVANNSQHGIVVRTSSNYNVVEHNRVSRNMQLGISIADSSFFVLDNNTAVANQNYGIYIYNSRHGIVSGNNVSWNVQHGVYLLGSTNNTVTGNWVSWNSQAPSGTYAGIRLSSNSNNNTLASNQVYQNAKDGIYISASRDNVITRNDVRGHAGVGSSGIFLTGSVSNTISTNTMESNHYGIYLFAASSFTNITGNTITGCSGPAIWIEASHDNAIWDNDVVSNGQHGMYLNTAHNNSILDNDVVFNGEHGMYLVTAHDNVISGNNVSLNARRGIWMSSGERNLVESNLVSLNNWDGMYIDLSQYIMISGNTVANNAQTGIRLQESDFNVLDNNTVTRNGQATNPWFGIMLSFSENNLVFGNNVSRNWKHGIGVLTLCTGNTISDNLVAFNGESADTWGGIYLSGATSTMIWGNNVSSNWKHGIWLRLSSNSNEVNGNMVIGNAKGAGVFYGVFVDGSSNNRMWDNEFSGNAGGRHALCTGGSGNVWDDDTRGNYWEDYRTKYPAAVASNGIWSIPYAIDTGYEDRFPLTREPAEPLDVVAIAGSGNITLTWSPPAVDGLSPVIRYSVYASQDGSSFSWIANTSALNTVLVHDGLGDNETWYYVVTASNNHGEGSNSTIASATTWTVPGQVTGLVATPGNQQVTLSWAPPANGGTPVTAYTVYWSTDNVAFTAIQTTYLQTTYQHAGLDNGTAYFYKVAAQNALGQGANSSVATATTWTVPGRVTGVTVVPGDMKLVISWTAPATGGTPITGYALYWSLDNDTFGRLTVGLVTTHTITSLPNGQGYYFKVAAINAVGEGTNSTVVAGEPQAPQGVDPLIITIVIVAAAGGGVALLFLLDKKGIIKLPKKSNA